MENEILGLGSNAFGTNTDSSEITIEGIPYPFYGDEFPHHVKADEERLSDTKLTHNKCISQLGGRHSKLNRIDNDTLVQKCNHNTIPNGHSRFTLHLLRGQGRKRKTYWTICLE
jgi:hypothetical protein